MLLAVLVLGAEVFVVGVAVLGWLVARARVGPRELALGGGVLFVSAAAYVAWITLMRLPLPG